MKFPRLPHRFVAILPSILKVWYYRGRGAEIGRDVNIGLFSIVAVEKIVIGDGVRIGRWVQFRGHSLSIGPHTQIRSHVEISVDILSIGRNSIVMEKVSVSSMWCPRSELRLGDRVNLGRGTFIDATEGVFMANDSGTGAGAILSTHTAWYSALEGSIYGGGPIRIGEGGAVGLSSTVLAGVNIGKYAAAGAGSVVRSDIADDRMAIGSPARQINTFRRNSLTAEEKLALVHTMLDELAELIRGQGFEVIPRRDGDRREIICERENYARKIVFGDDIPAGSPPSTIWIFMDADVESLRSFNGVWFQLTSRIARVVDDLVVKMIQRNFARYGIWFDSEKVRTDLRDKITPLPWAFERI